MTAKGPRVVIVGGGAAAAAAALALVERGIAPTVVDVGLQLEPERVELRARLANTVPSKWSSLEDEAERFVPAAGDVLAERRLFGSDVTFRDDGRGEIDFGPGVGLRPSYAAGGLTTVWGAGLLPHSAEDTETWPISRRELEQHYKQVLEQIPFAATHDELELEHPLFREPDGPLLRSVTGEAIISRLRRRRGDLERHGVVFGGSRLAVRVGHPAPSAGCVYCGHCLDGCPYLHIYNAGDTIRALAERAQIEYIGGVHVTEVQESNGDVTIVGRDSAGELSAIHADHVLLAAGALSTTRVLQNSKMLPATVEILDSQTVYIPFAWIGKPASAKPPAEHALAQVFVVLKGQAGSALSNSVHVSLYTYRPENVARAAARQRLLARLAGPAFALAMRSVVVGIAFLPSDVSSRLQMTALDDGKSRVTVTKGAKVDEATRQLGRALNRTLAPAGLVALTPLMLKAPVGGGYHLGGSIPMRADPAFGECDRQGRPFGSERLHVVDASCFPSIPGGAIALPAMANAHRIASSLGETIA